MRLLTRPCLLAAMLALSSALSVLPQTATAAPAQQKVQVPGYFRMALGTMEVTALYDGFVDLKPSLLKGASARDIQSLVARMFQDSTHGIQTAVNGFLVHTGDRLILVDTGAAACFGPTLGNMVQNLKAAGYQPEQVDAVLLTHLHPDHVCGLAGPDGKPVFTQATVHAAKAEADFWLSAEVQASKPDGMRPFFTMAQKAIEPYAKAGKFQTFAAGEALVPGVKAVATPGHTPGHTSFMVSQGGQHLLLWGDLVHNYASQLRKPEISIEFDVDSQQAMASRKAMLKQAAKEGLWVGGAHMPFPGIGHVGRDKKGYRWVPIEYGPLRAPR